MVRRAACVALLLTLAACGDPGPVSSTGPTPAPAPATVKAINLTPMLTLPPEGGSVEVRIETSANEHGGVVAPNVLVTLSVSAGALSASEVRTDGTGHARVTWTGTRHRAEWPDRGESDRDRCQLNQRGQSSPARSPRNA